MQALQPRRSGRRAYRPLAVPARSLEYAYYASIAYSVMADVLGISVPILAGMMVLGLAACCVLQVRARAVTVYEPIAWLLACATTFLLIQLIIHGQSLSDGDTRSFINWILGLIVVRSLCMRPGFSRRFPCVLLVLGSVTLPYITFLKSTVERARVGLQVGGSLSHIEGLAEWFGFCAIYFAIAGLHAKSTAFRVAAWTVAVGCVFVVTLTVSRTVLCATPLAIVIGFRGILKRGVVPAVLAIALVGIAYDSGMFEPAIARYSERGVEETGRERLWPAAIERISTSPLLGVGLSNVNMTHVLSHKASPPHNSFMWFALSSGILPFALYAAFWIQSLRRALSYSHESPDSAFRLPYLLFTFVVVMLADTGFMSFWALLALSVGAGPATSHATARGFVMFPRRPVPAAAAHRPGRARAMVRYRF